MEQHTTEKVLFVYNADSGFRNALIDSAHKLFSPSTYACSLCNITFGVIGEKAVWKKFRAKAAAPMVFMHKDEFAKVYASKFGHRFSYPIILIATTTSFDVLVKTEELDALPNAEALITLLETRLECDKLKN